MLAGDKSDRIQEFSHDGTFMASWGTTGSGDGQFENTDGLFATATPDGATVYVADSGVLSRVQQFKLLPLGVPCPDHTVEIPSTGQKVCLVTKWGHLGSADGDFRDPNSVAVSSDGEIYVLDQNNNRVEVFRNVAIGDVCPVGTTEVSAYGAERTCFVRKWGGTLGTGDGEMNGPESLALDETGQRVFVLDSFNNRVQVFRPDGAFLYKWGSAGSGDGQFQIPQGIAVDAMRDRVFIADTGNSRIEVFDTFGTFVTSFGHFGQGPGELDDPSEVDLDTAGRAYVADQFNDRVQVFAEVAVQGTTISVPAGTSMTLAAGDYSSFALGAGSQLTLTGGLYKTNSVTLGDKASLQVTAPTELRVFQSLTTGQKAVIGPAPGSHVATTDVRIAVLGGDGTLENPSAPVFELGQKSNASGLFYVPYGTFQIDPKATFSGDVCAPGPSITVLSGSLGGDVGGSGFGGNGGWCGTYVVTLPGMKYKAAEPPGSLMSSVGWPVGITNGGTCVSATCTEKAKSENLDTRCSTLEQSNCLMAHSACVPVTQLDGSKGFPGNRCPDGYFCQAGTCTDQHIDMPFLYKPYQSGSSLLEVYDHKDDDPSNPEYSTWMSLGPFAAHAGANTGHTNGNGKSDDRAFFFPDRTGMWNLDSGNPPTAHCTYPPPFTGAYPPTATDETCGVSGTYLQDHTPYYHLPDVPAPGYVAQVTLENFPRPGDFAFRHSAHWQVTLWFLGQKVEIRAGHIARIPAGSFLHQIILDVSKKYDPTGQGVGLDVDVPPNPMNCVGSVCPWVPEDYVLLRQQMRAYWEQLAKTNPMPGGHSIDYYCPDAAPTNLDPPPCHVPFFSYDYGQVSNGKTTQHPDQDIDQNELDSRAYFAEPQLHATEITGYPGWYAFPGAATAPSPVPDATFEFFVHNIPSKLGDGCQYEFLGAGSLTQAQAQKLHDADMSASDDFSSESLRYEDPLSHSWEWGAEGALCPTDSVGQLNDFSSLYTFMGGWDDSCTSGDQTFAFFPIKGSYAQAHTSLWHDSKLTTPADATHIVVFINHGAQTGQVTWPVDGGGKGADLVFAANEDDTAWGDVVDGPKYVRVQGGYTGSMLVRWRGQGIDDFACNADATIAQPCFYERLRFALGSKTGLRVAWGSRLTNSTSASNEMLPVPDASQCGTGNVVCYTHCY